MKKRLSSLILIFTAIIFLASCSNELKKLDLMTEDLDVKVERAKNLEILYSKEGKVNAKVMAPLLLRHKVKDEFIEFPEGVEVTFFNQKQQETSKLTACYAKRYEGQNKVLVQDQVVITNHKGERMESEEIYWDEKEEKIYSDEFIQITTDKQQIRGHGLVSNQDFTQYKIKNITGIVEVENQGL